MAKCAQNGLVQNALFHSLAEIFFCNNFWPVSIALLESYSQVTQREFYNLLLLFFCMPSSRKHRVLRKQIFPYTKPPARELNFYLIAGILLFLLGFWLFTVSGESNYTWLFWILGVVIAFNAFWLRFDFAQPFGFKYIISMLKTKKFVQQVISLAHHAKWFEKVCLGGMFLGFGIFGVDYWFYHRAGKKMSAGKRVLMLVISALILTGIYYFFLKILFAVPILAPLLIPCLIGFVLLGFGGFSLVLLLGYGLLSVWGLFSAKELCPAVAPVIPGAPIPGLGVVIPLVGWISLVIVLVVHEFSHGIMMAYYREKIKSVGVLLAGIIPVGAFVEQDDKTFDKLDDKKSLMVLSAGSASNLLTIPVAFALLLLVSIAAQPFAPAINEEYQKTYSGVQILGVSDTVSYCGTTVEAPAKGKLMIGDKILAVNGTDVNSVGGVSSAILAAKGDLNFFIERKECVLANCESQSNCIGGGESCEVTDLNIIVSPYKFEDLGIKRIGVEFGIIPTGYEVPFSVWLGNLLISNISVILFLLFIISFAAGSFNYFPSDPFDGGRMAKIILAPYFVFMGLNKSETQKLIGRLFAWILVVSLLLNVIPYITLFI